MSFRFSRLPKWINALSLDSVAVAIVWQWIFWFSFSGSRPSATETLALGATVWLIYTADRLLDASRLNPSEPATFRHRFHARHRTWLSLVWCLVLVLDVVLVCCGISAADQPLGLALAAGVLVYGAGVHFVVSPERTFPKEPQIGLLFAGGVSLPVWREAFGIELVISIGLASILFTCNCVIVAIFERDIDQAQQFDSLARRFDHAGPWLRKSIFALAIASFAFGLIGMIPPLIACSVVFSCLLMLTTNALLEKTGLPWPPGLLADFTLAVSPLFCWPLIW